MTSGNDTDQDQPRPRVAVIGTGTMGTAMALRLLGAGMEVDVWSRHAASTEVLEPIFAVLGRAALWLGPAGAGSRMKLVLNTWLAFQVEGAAEVASLATHLEVPASGLMDALRGNPLASPYALGKLAKMLEHDDHADFSIDLALKDLDLATAEAGVGVAPLAATIAKRWRGLVEDGWGGLDVSAARHGLGSDDPSGPGAPRSDSATGDRAPSKSGRAGTGASRAQTALP